MFFFTQASKELQQAQTSRPESTQIQPQPGEKDRNPRREGLSPRERWTQPGDREHKERRGEGDTVAGYRGLGW